MLSGNKTRYCWIFKNVIFQYLTPQLNFYERSYMEAEADIFIQTRQIKAKRICMSKSH